MDGEVIQICRTFLVRGHHARNITSGFGFNHGNLCDTVSCDWAGHAWVYRVGIVSPYDLLFEGQSPNGRNKTAVKTGSTITPLAPENLLAGILLVCSRPESDVAGILSV